MGRQERELWDSGVFRAIMERESLTIRAMAEKLDVSPNTVNLWRTTDGTEPTFSHVRRICDVLGVHPWVFDRHRNDRPKERVTSTMCEVDLLLTGSELHATPCLHQAKKILTKGKKKFSLCEEHFRNVSNL